MYLRFLYPAILMLWSAQLFAQGADRITGVVSSPGERGTIVLPGANVTWSGTLVGSTTGVDGRFSIPYPDVWPATLLVSYVGYRSDSLRFEAPPKGQVRFTLSPTVDLPAVEVVEKRSTVQLDSRTIISTEIIGQGELKRAACCDLSESFETNATVDVSYNDAVSGTKTIRMLGLDGKYAQLSVENIPFVRGLSTGSGLMLIPGTWINEINLSKGIGTAVNGPNAMTGQIDLCLLQPATEPPLFMNMYGNSQGRAELNLHTAQRTGASSSNLLMVHGNWFDNEMDQNNDGFMDMPLGRRINIMDRWMFRNERRSGQLTLRYVTDQRNGGQSARHGATPLQGEHAEHRPNMLYGIDIHNEMVDVLGKYGFIFANDPTKSIGLIVSGRRHEMRSLYGERRYDGDQESFYGNMVYQQLLGTGTDQIKAGLSFQYDDYAEVFRDSTFHRTERMPGLFAEYTRKRADMTLVGGLRVDDNDLFGTAVSPRLHTKFDLGPLTHFRLSAGHAFRTALPLVESASVLASSRRVVVEGPLGMERAWNFGASVLHKFKWLDRKWAVGLDGYRTLFVDQVVTDLDRAPNTVAFYMLDGLSYANSLLVDVQLQLSRVINLKASYRWYDVRTTYDGRTLERPFTPRHRALIDLAYSDLKERWRFDVALNLHGQSRIPGTASNPEEYRMDPVSPVFTTLNAQMTHIVGAWEFYLGGENLTSTLQQQQIIAPDDPFGPYFDASLIWGPTNRAMLFGGFRFTLPSKEIEKK